MRTIHLALLLVPIALASERAWAGDVWSDPYPGIRYLHRSTSEPKEIHATIVDLSHPGITLRATKPEEKGLVPTAYAQQVGAAVSVNGDFYSGGYVPNGLAVGDGVHWPNSKDDSYSAFIACTAGKQCTIDTSGKAVARDPSWTNVVGGVYGGLVAKGQVTQTPAKDSACGAFCTTPHPRTAAGLDATGTKLILVVVEGRRAPVSGMSLHQLATLMQELGAYDAVCFDGGGSTGMVIGGKLVNQRPSGEPGERAVANHLAVLHDGTSAPRPDARSPTDGGSSSSTSDSGARADASIGAGDGSVGPRLTDGGDNPWGADAGEGGQKATRAQGACAVAGRPRIGGLLLVLLGLLVAARRRARRS